MMRSINRLMPQLEQSELRRILSENLPAKPYTGVLGKLMPIQIGGLLSQKPDWYVGSQQDWLADVATIKQRETDAWLEREQALAEHYGIRWDEPPKQGDPCHELLLAVLQDLDVPAFRYQLAQNASRKERRGAPPSLSYEQIADFAELVYLSLENGLTEARDVVRNVRERNAMRKALMLPKRGAKKSGFEQQPVPLSRSTAQRLLAQLRSAWCAVLDGTGNAFQYRVVSVALQDRRSNSKELWSAVFLIPKSVVQDSG